MVRLNEATITREAPEQTATQCKHHWIIETAQGPVSRGVCRLCGAVKEFYNSPPETSLFLKRRPPVPELAELDKEEPKLEQEAEAEEETETGERGETKKRKREKVHAG